MDFTKLFVEVDDFWLDFKPGYQKRLLACGSRQRRRDMQLSTSEIMTILIAFQTSGYRTFKHFYLHLLAHHRRDLPHLVRYHLFVALIGRATVPLFAYLWRRCRGPVTEIGFVDSTALKVCSNMKNKLLDMTEKLLLRKRSLIETVNDQLKNVCQVKHSRHRSPHNFVAHLLAGLIACTKKPKLPSLNLHGTANDTNMILA